MDEPTASPNPHPQPDSCVAAAHTDSWWALAVRVPESMSPLEGPLRALLETDLSDPRVTMHLDRSSVVFSMPRSQGAPDELRAALDSTLRHWRMTYAV